MGLALTLAALLAAALGGRVLMGPADAAQAASAAAAPAEPAALSTAPLADAASVPSDGLVSAPRAVVAQSTVRLEQVAHNPLGGSGLNADIWLHHGFAYVGTWASGSDRVSRSSLVTTKVSPARQVAKASRSPGRSRLVPVRPWST